MSTLQMPNLPDAPVMPVYTPGMSTVLSIWPFDQTHMTHHAGIITYGHPAAAKDQIKVVQMNPERVTMRPSNTPVGVEYKSPYMSKYTNMPIKSGIGYTRIDVYDTYTRARNFSMESDNTPVVIVDHPITALSVADMLVKIFSGGRPGDYVYGGPGMVVYDPKRSLEEQLAELHAKQTLFAEGIVNEAEGFAAERQWKNITSVHRTLAKWLGYTPKDWGIASQRNVAVKKCVNCQADIPLRALKCTNAGCGVNLVQFYQEFGLGSDDEAVLDVLKWRKSSEPKAEPKPTPAKPEVKQ